MKEYLTQHLVELRLSAPYKKQQNGSMESTIGVIQNLVRTYMLQYNIPAYFMEDAIKYACYILNSFSISKDSTSTPYEQMTGHKADFKPIIPLYSQGVAHVSSDERQGKGKLAPKGNPVRFLGFPNGYKDSYEVYDPLNNTVSVRHDVRFNYDQLVDNQFNDAAIKVNQSTSTPPIPSSVTEA